MEAEKAQRGDRKNEWIYICHKVIFSAANLISSGSMVQSFLLALGVSSQNISAYSAWILIAQVLTMAAISFFCDRVRRLKKILTVVVSIMPVGVLAFILGGNIGNAIPQGPFGIVLAGGVLLNLEIGRASCRERVS